MERESTDGKQEESGETGKKGGNTSSVTSTHPGGHGLNSGGPRAPPGWVAHGENTMGRAGHHVLDTEQKSCSDQRPHARVPRLGRGVWGLMPSGMKEKLPKSE